MLRIRMLGAIAFGFVFVAVTFAASHADAAVMPRIMVVGDSISQGSSGDYTWRYRLAKHLASSGSAADFVGPRTDLYDNVRNVQGDKRYADPAFDTAHASVWGQPALYAKDSIAADVAAHQPDYLLVLLGVNDLAWFSGSAEAAESLRTLVLRAQSAKPGIRIIMGQVLPTGRAATEATFALSVADLNNRITALVASTNTSSNPVRLATTATGFVAGSHTYDGTHPNANGEVRIAAAFADSLSGNFALGATYPRPLPTLPTGPITSPTLLVANGDGNAKLSWSEAPGATGYWVWTRNVTEGQTWGRLPYPLAWGNMPWTAGLLSNGGTYEFKLETAKGNDTGVFSNVATARPTGPTPAGGSLSISSGNGQATLTWSKPANTTAVKVWTRNVTEGQAWGELPIPLGGTTWTSTGLANGGTYEYKVQSVNGYIKGGYSNVATARPTGPAPAGGSLNISSGNGKATLTWSRPANTTAVKVWTRNVTEGQAWGELPIPLGGTTWTSTGLMNGGTYEYKVQSVNGYIKGGYSNVATAKPLGPYPVPPSITSAIGGNGQVALTWTASPNATGYYVYWKLVGGFDILSPWGSLAAYQRSQYPVAETSWTVPFLANARQYQFYVQPVNGLQSRGCSITDANGCSFPAFGFPEAPPLSITRQAQLDPNWCCTAAARATMSFFGVTPDQAALARQIGILEPIAYGFANPYSVASEISKGGRSYAAQAGLGGASLSNIVVNAVNGRQGPVVIMVQTNKLPWYSSTISSNLAHCLVIYGYDNYDITGELKYLVWDPAAGAGGGNHVILASDWDRIGYDPAGFFGGIGHWIVSPGL